MLSSIAKNPQSAADASASGASQTNMGIVVRERSEDETCSQALFAIASVSDTAAQSRELRTDRMTLSTYGRRKLTGHWVTQVKNIEPYTSATR